jgi:hypothetical protein
MGTVLRVPGGQPSELLPDSPHLTADNSFPNTRRLAHRSECHYHETFCAHNKPKATENQVHFRTPCTHTSNTPIETDQGVYLEDPLDKLEIASINV